MFILFTPVMLTAQLYSYKKSSNANHVKHLVLKYRNCYKINGRE